MAYTLTIQDRNGFRHGSTRYDSVIDARKEALRRWKDDYKSVIVMKAAKYISLDVVGWIEWTDRGFVWKAKGKKAKDLNWDGTLVR